MLERCFFFVEESSVAFLFYLWLPALPILSSWCDVAPCHQGMTTQRVITTILDSMPCCCYFVLHAPGSPRELNYACGALALHAFAPRVRIFGRGGEYLGIWSLLLHRSSESRCRPGRPCGCQSGRLTLCKTISERKYPAPEYSTFRRTRNARLLFQLSFFSSM